MTTSTLLSVYLDNDYVGTIHNTLPMAFEYDGSWLSNINAQAIDPTIPLQTGIINSYLVYAFFENLLPEGDQRKTLSFRHHVTTAFGLLAAIGGDNAGAIVILPYGEIPQKTQYRHITWEQLRDHPYQSEPDNANESTQEHLVRRVSISGAQFKTLLTIDANGSPCIPLGNSPTTLIIKPDIVRTDLHCFASVINETIIMRTAFHCGLPTADVHY